MTVRDEYRRDVLAVGWAHTPFGNLRSADLKSLVVTATREALTQASVDAIEIDAVFVAHFNSGLHPLSFISSLVLEAAPGLRGVPATRVENACASGSAAVHQGIASLLAGTAKNVLVVGVEKMTHAAPDRVATALLGADYETPDNASGSGFVGLFADVARHYSLRYGDCSETMGLIAAKNHRNGVANPYAQLRRDLGEEFCQTVSARNPMIASPLRRTDCSPVSDGAAAMVLSTEHRRAAHVDAVRVRGFGHANDFLPSSKRDPLAFVATEIAWHRALDLASVETSDLSLLELHDCFTIAELNLYEALGLAPRGRGADLLADGTVYPQGALPVNVSGGLKAKGHPVGATGVSQHVLAAMQLSGTAGQMQLPGASLAAVHNMGGLAVANYVTILEAT